MFYLEKNQNSKLVKWTQQTKFSKIYLILSKQMNNIEIKVMMMMKMIMLRIKIKFNNKLVMMMKKNKLLKKFRIQNWRN